MIPDDCLLKQIQESHMILLLIFKTKWPGFILLEGRKENIVLISCDYMYVLCCFSHVRLFGTLWTIAHQAPLSIGLHRQEYWTELLFPSSGDLPDLRIEPTSLTSPALAGRFFTTSTTWDPVIMDPAKYWGLFYHITRKNGYKGNLVVFIKASSWVFFNSV